MADHITTSNACDLRAGLDHNGCLRDERNCFTTMRLRLNFAPPAEAFEQSFATAVNVQQRYQEMSQAGLGAAGQGRHNAGPEAAPSWRTLAIPATLEDLAKLPAFRCRVIVIGGYLDDKTSLALAGLSSYTVSISHGEAQCLQPMEYVSASVPTIWPHDPRQAQTDSPSPPIACDVAA